MKSNTRLDLTVKLSDCYRDHPKATTRSRMPGQMGCVHAGNCKGGSAEEGAGVCL